MLTLLLSFTLSAYADDGATLDPSLLETEVVRDAIERQALEAQLAELRAKCAAKSSCKPAAPAKPKATAKPSTPKPAAPKAPAAPPAAPAPAASAPQPDPHTAEIESLKAEITELTEALRAEQTRPIVVNVPAPVVNVAASDVTVNPTVVEHTEHTETVRVSGTRFQIGLSEMGTVAPPLPGSDAWVSDRTELFGRFSWDVHANTWVALEIDGGYGFSADATSIRALPELVQNLGEGADLVVGIGPSFVCEGAFTGDPLCSATRTGGQAQVGIDFQAFGPVNIELFVGGGYDMVDSSTAGIGGVGYGHGGIRFFAGPVGSGSSVTVR